MNDKNQLGRTSGDPAHRSNIPMLDWLRLKNWRHRLVLLLIVLGPAWLLDKAVFSLSPEEHKRNVLTEFSNVVKQFAEPWGIGIVGLSICVLDRARRRAVLRLLLIALVAGGVAAGLKLAVGRERPRVTKGATVFTGPQWPGQTKDDPSLPSAHTTVAFALSCALSRLYPHGRILFLFFAFSCGFSRVYSGLHFLTDVLIGAWLGWELGALVWHSRTVSLLAKFIPEFSWLPTWKPEAPPS